MKTRILVVDSERATRESILKILKEDSEVELIGECQNGPEAIAMIEAGAPDLILLDVNLSEIDGFDVLNRVDQTPPVIVVTASDAHALRSYEIHAIDYLLKPIDDRRLKRALGRAKTLISNNKIANLSLYFYRILEHQVDDRLLLDALHQRARRAYLQQLPLKKHGRVVFLKVNKIDWIEGANQYVRLHFEKRTHLLRKSMKKLEADLDPHVFMRIHRSVIVNLLRIKELEIDPPIYGVVLKNGARLKVSRKRCEELQNVLTRTR